MADKKIQLHTQDGTDNLYPVTKAANVTGLATVATSGSYNDLSNKPSIPTIPTNYVKTDASSTITTTPTDGTSPLNIRNNGTYQYTKALSMMAPNMSANQRYILEIGKASSTKNRGQIEYVHKADGSNTNYLSLGMYGVDNVFNITGDGFIGINNVAPTCNLDVTGSTKVSKWHADSHYAYNLCRLYTTTTPNQMVVKTKILYKSSTHMPVIRLYGYAYGVSAPIELKVGFYIYNENYYSPSAISMGAWRPDIYLFKYTEDSVEYVALGIKGSIYFPGFQVDAQVGSRGAFNGDFKLDGWTTQFKTVNDSNPDNIIPDVGTDNCVKVTYKSTLETLSFSDGTKYDGTAAKTITYSTVGAASSSHNHDTVYAKKSDFSAYDSVKAITAANITSWNGKLSSVPTASSSVLGGIKIASPFTIDNGVLKINTFGGYNAPGVVNCSEDVDDKVLMSDGAWRNIASNYIKPAISKQYRSASYYGSANNYNGASWFFMYVRPNSWQSTWTVKFKIRSTVTGQPTYDSTTYSTISGVGGTIVYHNWNIRNGNVYSHYYIASERLKEAGYNAGHAHAFGISLYNASNATSASYPRNFDLDYYECDNCTVTILDTPVKYDGVAGYSTTNFESVTGYNAVDNGLQESGDNNTINQQYIQGYGFAGPVQVNYGLWGRGRDDKILAVSGYGITYSNTAYVSKGVPTTWATSKAYAVNNPVYYAVNGGFYYCIKAHTSSSSILPTNTTYWSAYRWYNSEGFDWHQPIVWQSNGGTYAPGANCNGIVGYINYPSLDFRYCDNAVASNSASNTLGLSVREPVFLKGYMKDGLFYLKPETVVYNNNTYYRVWTQTIPTSKETYTVDNKTYPVVYWQIGHGYYGSSSYTIKDYRLSLAFAQPMYWYHNGAFRIYEEGINQNDFADFAFVSSFTGEQTTGWDDAATKAHTHSNKSVIDGITSANITSWNGKGTYSKPSGGIPSTDVAFNYAGSSSKGGAASSVAQSLTFNNGGSGAASGTTFNGSTARTISYNTIGAAASSHSHAQSDITGLSTSLAAKLDKSEADDTYLKSVPTASSSVLGGIKISSPFTISNGVLGINSFSGSAAGLVPAYSGDEDDSAVLKQTGWGHLTAGQVGAAAASHNHSAANITSGTLAVARGGTGKTTGVDAANYFLNELTTGSSTPKDADYFISQYANGGTTTTTYHRRPVSALWDLYKTKCVTGVHANTAASSSIYTGKPIMFVPGTNMGVTVTNQTNYVRVYLESYGSCLVEGTKIKMIDGSEKNIEDIEPGESIMSYDPNTRTNVEAVVVSNSCTGTADDYTNYYFDDGNFVTIYGKHCLYNADEGTARGVDFWEIGWTGMNDKNEEITFIGSEDISHAGRKKHYDIRSSNKLYYANGILTAQALTLDYSTLPDRDPELPQVFLDAIKADYDSSANITKHKMNKNYGKRLVPILREMKAQQKKMDDNKKRLADTDYIVSKFTEGFISASEWAKSKSERSNWRKLVNEAEDALATVKTQFEALKEEYKPQSTKRERFNAAVARDNACLDALKEYYKEKNSK